MKRTPAKKAAVREIVPADIPEVATYMTAQSNLDAFVSEHAVIMDELSLLAEARNDAMQEAAMVIRSMSVDEGVGVSCGPLRFRHFSRKINAERMYDSLSKEDFAKCGGSVQRVPSYVVDRATCLRALDNGEVAAEVADEFHTNTPNYEKIAELVLP